MIHICFLIPELNIGGAERQLLTLVRAMDQQRFRITVLTFRSGGALAEEFATTGVTLRSLDKGGAIDTPAFWLRLMRAIGQLQPDIVHGYMGICNIYSVLLKLTFPKLRSVYGIRASTRDISAYSLGNKMLFRLECELARRANLIIGNSESGKAFYVEHGFPAEKYRVISNGIDTERFQPHPRMRQQIRDEWGIQPDALLIGIVGRLEPIKDHPTFLRAAAQWVQTNPQARFVCIGGGNEGYIAQMRELTQTLGIAERVIFAGQRRDLHLVYSALDMLTLTSLSEGFPNVIGEAMACGVPCVTTRVGDAAVMVGDLGVVVPVGDAMAIAQAGQTLLQRGLADLKPKVRERITQHFSVAQLVQQTEQALTALL